MKTILALAAAMLALAGCGPGKPPAPASAPAAPAADAPVIAGVGTIASVEGGKVVLDHEATAGGLPAGRHEFHAYADALAEAPLDPGARVAFSYRQAKPDPVLTELKAR